MYSSAIWTRWHTACSRRNRPNTRCETDSTVVACVTDARRFSCLTTSPPTRKRRATELAEKCPAVPTSSWVRQHWYDAPPPMPDTGSRTQLRLLQRPRGEQCWRVVPVFDELGYAHGEYEPEFIVAGRGHRSDQNSQRLLHHRRIHSVAVPPLPSG